MTLVQVDLSQAELRVMAALSGDPWMLSALQEGAGDYFDTHMMPICFPHVDMATIDAVAKKEYRVQIKTVVYGLAFGREAAAIAVELGISTREAQQIIDNYLSTANQFARWREDVKEAATDKGARDLLINPFGRRFQSEIITSRNKNNIEREALSFLPQSTASDICLATAIRVHPWVKEQDSHIVGLVHDAILVEAPNVSTAGNIALKIMAEFRVTGQMVFGDVVPFLSDFGIGNSWGDL